MELNLFLFCAFVIWRSKVSNVKALKERLHHLHGLPPRFRQRLLHRGSTLDDAYKLDSPLDLNLVVQLGGPVGTFCPLLLAQGPP